MTTSPASSASSRQAAVDAALLVLKSMGLSLDDLTAAPSNRPPVPTFAEYVPVVSATVTSATLTAARPRADQVTRQHRAVTSTHRETTTGERTRP
jgi:hypothetical protein